MVHDPISVLDALMIALSGIVIVFLMLALLWGSIAVISVRWACSKAHRASGFGQCSGSGGCGSGSSTCTGSAGQGWKASARWRRPALWLLSATKRAFRSISLYLSPSRRVLREKET